MPAAHRRGGTMALFLHKNSRPVQITNIFWRLLDKFKYPAYVEFDRRISGDALFEWQGDDPMEWFDYVVRDNTGSESDMVIAWHHDIARIADATLKDWTMPAFTGEFFGTQKSFAEYLGVSESTVAGWVKNNLFPDYAKRAALAAYYACRNGQKVTEAERDAARPKVVRDGKRYQVVHFEVDEAGVTIGRILARDIPTEKDALVLAGSIRAWELLGEAERLIHHEIDNRGGEGPEWYHDTASDIELERKRTFDHKRYLKEQREWQALSSVEKLERLLPKNAESTAEGETSDA